MISCKKSVCEISIEDTALETANLCRTCRYHKKERQIFQSGQCFPRGFCPHAYQKIYPYALALLYNGQYPDGDGSKRHVTVPCAGGDDHIDIKLSVQYLYPKILRALKDSAVTFLHALDVPAEYPDKDVIIEVVDVCGRCAHNLKKGDRFKFNLFNRQELCPASFYALYPVLVSPSEKTSPGHEVLAHCPDPLGASYRVQNRSFSCDLFLKQMNKTRDDEKICPLALYSVFPYYWTYIHGGKFDWVRKNEKVRVRCPQTDGPVMEIELIRQGASGDGAIRAEIIHSPSHCAFGYIRGNTFVLDSGSQRVSFEDLVDSIVLSGAFPSEKERKGAEK